jgi:hypothetical protein
MTVQTRSTLASCAEILARALAAFAAAGGKPHEPFGVIASAVPSDA